MKKKLFGMLLAGALIASQCVTAFAAGSKEAGTKVDGLSTVPEGYEITTEVSVSHLPEARQEAARAEIEQANSGKLDAIVETLTNSEDKEILQDAHVLTQVFDVEGKAGKVSFTVARLPKNTSAVYALHLADNGEWEVIPATFNLETGVVTVNFKSLSPVVLIAKTEDTGSSGSHRTRSSDDLSSGSGAAPAVTADGLIASPRTGVVSDWTLWMGMAVVLLGISGVAFRKTRA